MKKKITAILLCAAMALSMTACSNSENGGEPESSSSTTDQGNSSSTTDEDRSSSASDRESDPEDQYDTNATSAEFFEYTEENDEITITGYTGTYAEVVIPRMIENKPVTQIGEEAFYECGSLRSAAIPDGVKLIGEYAFSHCESLTSVFIFDNVTEIGDYAFEFCHSLKSVTIPKSVTKIGNYAFSGCDLMSVDIPESVTEIGGHAFDSTPWIKDKRKEDPLVVVNGILIDGQACGGDVNILYNVNKIGRGAFELCESLTSVTIPESVTEIGGNAFYNCTTLKSVTIPEGMAVIGELAFTDCTSLTSVTLPDSMTQIGDGAFMNCKCDVTYSGKTYKPGQYNDLYTAINGG